MQRNPVKPSRNREVSWTWGYATLAAAATASTLLVAAGAAAGQENSQPEAFSRCEARAEIVSKLAEKYSEHQVWRELQPDGLLAEGFASYGGTWSLLKTSPDGLSCFVSTGDGAAMDGA